MPDGDVVKTVEQRRVDLKVSETELAARQQHAVPIVAPKEVGWLSIYQRTVQPLPKGAVLLK